jgi:hypothetical protein
MARAVIVMSDLPKLKRLYNKAVRDKKAEFQFKGNTVLTEYAKYVIEYLEMKG